MDDDGSGGRREPVKTRLGRILGAASCVVVGVLACERRLAIDGPGPTAAPFVWTPHDQLCVVQPEDARFDGTVYAGSGATVADRIARAVARHRHIDAIRITDRAHAREACVARRGTYTIVPVIQAWEHPRGPVLVKERVRVELSLEPCRGTAAPRTVTFEVRESRPNLFTDPRDPLPAEFDDAVLRLLSGT